MKSLKFWIVFILCISFTTFSLLPAGAQSTIATGSIQGTVTDPNGAVVPDAAITITNKATGQSNKTASTASGTYTSGALIPGEYQIRIEAKGFRTPGDWRDGAGGRDHRRQRQTLRWVDQRGGGSHGLSRGGQHRTSDCAGRAHPSRLKICRSTDATSSIWRSLSRAFKSRTAPTSIPPRTASLPSPSAGVSDAPRASRWTAWTSATRPSAPPRRTFLPARSRNSRSASLRSISQPNSLLRAR